MVEENDVSVWRLTDESKAGIHVTEEAVQIIGSRQSAIQVDETDIVLMANNISFGASSKQMKTGGFFTMGDEFSTMIPSTIVTLIPQRNPTPPFGFMQSIIPMIPVFIATLVATQIGNNQGE